MELISTCLDHTDPILGCIIDEQARDFGFEIPPQIPEAMLVCHSA
jgi:hypothetical protein